MGKQGESNGKESRTRRRKAPAEKTAGERESKKAVCLRLLCRRQGASVAELQDALGWQPHSVRGLLSGTIRKLKDCRLETTTAEGKPRRYRLLKTQQRS